MVGALALAFAACANLTASSEGLLSGLTDGQEIAARLRAQRPAENSEINGLLKIRDGDGKRTTLPLKVTTVLGESSWRIVYDAHPADPKAAARLTVIHADNQSPRYQLEGAGAPTPSSISPTPLNGDHAMVPFANTDFWLADLGLQFLYWPEQRLVPDAKITMRKSTPCKVLDSLNPRASDTGYTRVRSWVAIENGGLVYAEAYDYHHKLLKVFEISNVEKVNGHWELKEMKIRNEQTDSVTRLEFDLKVESP